MNECSTKKHVLDTSVQHTKPNKVPKHYVYTCMLNEKIRSSTNPISIKVSTLSKRASQAHILYAYEAMLL